MMDTEARQLALQYLNRAERGQTESLRLLDAAQQANMDFAQNQSDAAKARRAALARRAYQSRVSAELGRVMAAYALLAEREGSRALSARQAMARVQDAQKREVLVEEAKGGELRRGIMLQAMQAAAKAFDAAPGLPEKLVAAMPGPEQSTVGMTEMFRPPAYIKRAGAFFPMDVRAAAGTLAGLAEPEAWTGDVEKSLTEDAANVVKRAHELAAEVAAQEPGAAALAEEAKSLGTQLKARGAAEAAGTAGFPWLHVVGGGAVLYILWKVLK